MCLCTLPIEKIWFQIYCLIGNKMGEFLLKKWGDLNQNFNVTRVMDDIEVLIN